MVVVVVVVTTVLLYNIYIIYISVKSLSRFRSKFFLKNLLSNLHRKLKKIPFPGLDEANFFKKILSSN
jgi:ABC-type uncharacterized transport system permease subunit